MQWLPHSGKFVNKANGAIEMLLLLYVPQCIIVPLPKYSTISTDLWHSIVAKDPLEYGDGSADDDIIADILHNGGRLACNQRQQHGRLVEVPEEEQFAPTRCRTANVAEQVGVRVPEDTVETQHHLRGEMVVNQWRNITLKAGIKCRLCLYNADIITNYVYTSSSSSS